MPCTEKADSDIATAIRTLVVLSGIATGASWLCYYYAIQNGEGSVVVPIDKLSIIVTVVFSFLVFKEKLSKKLFWVFAL